MQTLRLSFRDTDRGSDGFAVVLFLFCCLSLKNPAASHTSPLAVFVTTGTGASGSDIELGPSCGVL